MGREGESRGAEYGWKQQDTKTSFKMQNPQTALKASFLYLKHLYVYLIINFLVRDISKC